MWSTNLVLSFRSLPSFDSSSFKCVLKARHLTIRPMLKKQTKGSGLSSSEEEPRKRSHNFFFPFTLNMLSMKEQIFFLSPHFSFLLLLSFRVIFHSVRIGACPFILAAPDASVLVIKIYSGYSWPVNLALHAYLVLWERKALLWRRRG